MLLSVAILAGCGSKESSTGSTAASAPPTTPAHGTKRHAFSQNEQIALAACRHAVVKQSSLSPSAESEISALCDRVNSVVEDNEATVRAVCQELANAVLTASAAARNSVYSDCYGEYARTIK